MCVLRTSTTDIVKAGSKAYMRKAFVVSKSEQHWTTRGNRRTMETSAWEEAVEGKMKDKTKDWGKGSMPLPSRQPRATHYPRPPCTDQIHHIFTARSLESI